MSRLTLVFLAMILLVSFVQGKRFVAYNNFTLIPAPFTRDLNVSRRMYQVKLFQNGSVPLVLLGDQKVSAIPYRNSFIF